LYRTRLPRWYSDPHHAFTQRTRRQDNLKNPLNNVHERRAPTAGTSWRSLHFERPQSRSIGAHTVSGAEVDVLRRSFLNAVLASSSI
jgi:hypothetical protein